MEDRVSVRLQLPCNATVSLYAVFDGHSDSWVSHSLAQHLLSNLSHALCKNVIHHSSSDTNALQTSQQLSPATVETQLRRVIEQADAGLLAQYEQGKGGGDGPNTRALPDAGSTALVAVVMQPDGPAHNATTDNSARGDDTDRGTVTTVVVAGVGNSRAVLCRRVHSAGIAAATESIGQCGNTRDTADGTQTGASKPLAAAAQTADERRAARLAKRNRRRQCGATHRGHPHHAESDVSWQPVLLSSLHEGSNESEVERVRAAGGSVFAHPGGGILRLAGELELTRALGDVSYRQHGLIPTPDITVYTVTKGDDFFVLATDGVFESMSDSQVCEHAAAALQGRTHPDTAPEAPAALVLSGVKPTHTDTPPPTHTNTLPTPHTSAAETDTGHSEAIDEQQLPAPSTTPNTHSKDRGMRTDSDNDSVPLSHALCVSSEGSAGPLSGPAQRVANEAYNRGSGDNLAVVLVPLTHTLTHTKYDSTATQHTEGSATELPVPARLGTTGSLTHPGHSDMQLTDAGLSVCEGGLACGGVDVTNPLAPWVAECSVVLTEPDGAGDTHTEQGTEGLTGQGAFALLRRAARQVRDRLRCTGLWAIGRSASLYECGTDTDTDAQNDSETEVQHTGDQHGPVAIRPGAYLSCPAHTPPHVPHDADMQLDDHLPAVDAQCEGGVCDGSGGTSAAAHQYQLDALIMNTPRDAGEGAHTHWHPYDALPGATTHGQPTLLPLPEGAGVGAGTEGQQGQLRMGRPADRPHRFGHTSSTSSHPTDTTGRMHADGTAPSGVAGPVCPADSGQQCPVPDTDTLTNTPHGVLFYEGEYEDMYPTHDYLTGSSTAAQDYSTVTHELEHAGLIGAVWEGSGAPLIEPSHFDPHSLSATWPEAEPEPWMHESVLSVSGAQTARALLAAGAKGGSNRPSQALKGPKSLGLGSQAKAPRHGGAGQQTGSEVAVPDQVGREGTGTANKEGTEGECARGVGEGNDRWQFGRRFAAGHFGEVWRGVRRTPNTANTSSTKQPSASLNTSESVVIKRVFAERGRAVLEAGMREAYFGALMLPYQTARKSGDTSAHPGFEHLVPFIEAFSTYRQPTGCTTDKHTDSQPSKAQSTSQRCSQKHLTRDLWLVFGAAGQSIHDLMYEPLSHAPYTHSHTESSHSHTDDDEQPGSAEQHQGGANEGVSGSHQEGVSGSTQSEVGFSVLGPSRWWRAMRGASPNGEGVMKSLMRQLLLAVEALQTLNITHRDIKVDNILLNVPDTTVTQTQDSDNPDKSDPHSYWDMSVSTPHLTLIDFGSALDPGSLKAGLWRWQGPSDAQTTHEYAAPEALFGRYWEGMRSVRPRTWAYDMWSVGVVWLELLLGTPDVWALPPGVQSTLNKRLARLPETERASFLLLRGLMQWCITPPRRCAADKPTPTPHTPSHPLHNTSRTPSQDSPTPQAADESSQAADESSSQGGPDSPVVPWECTDGALLHMIAQRDPTGEGLGDNLHAVNLLRSLLQWAPGKRPNATEALAHPYFADSTDEDT